MWFGIISLFPDMFEALNVGITGRAIKEQLLSLHFWNPRDFARDKHKSVDDHPYGGGPGMVMMAEPLQAAIHAAKKSAPAVPTVIYLSPQGRQFNQEAAVELAAKPAVVFVAGRYEGIDERIIEQEIDEEWSIGDYILTGGELAAMVMIDAAARLIPGTVGDQDSVAQDSLTTGFLKYPQYTRPENFAGSAVPEVLLSGHHKQIERWRLKQSLGKTWLKRPDLLSKKRLNDEASALLAEFIEEFLHSGQK
ncbi:tRNA (guanosine(37)-N1)-methyltransferase TrmD [Aquicella lusitana]|uniref:tRNA (guanine-N(1)-)-methyltransferase n=1 Tax=Aquicella lusitana TaxID=254246 RepID=A0A370GN66_9COXI|nr:tRNA (guanosine(37)-N1)-methyltransferase TrmD [Aquicella lusitana]RDI44830.1 tRNA (guanine37-N(1)-) methyltransferase [Aquicella lusitana]VVC73027.1 tRNA (guanine-N(1)-)-methyltransferase [Aquicella lusitana]